MAEMKVTVTQLTDGRWHSSMQSGPRLVVDIKPTREKAFGIVRRRIRLWVWERRMGEVYPGADTASMKAQALEYADDVPTAPQPGAGYESAAIAGAPIFPAPGTYFFDEPPATIDWDAIAHMAKHHEPRDGDTFRRGGA